MEKFYTIKEVAEALHRTEKTIKKYIGRGLTVVDLGGGYLVAESSLLSFLENRKVTENS